MQERLLKYTLVFGVLFSVTAMAVMLRFAATKTIVIAEETASEVMAENRNEGETERDALTFTEKKDGQEYMYIPLPGEVRADDIVIENRYAEHVLNIFINGKYGAFYRQNTIAGNHMQVADGHFYEEGESTRLKLELFGLYEHQYVFENGMLQLKFVKPDSLYEKIVVIDAAHGGADEGAKVKGAREKDITLDIAVRLRRMLEASDVRVYFTRLDDTEPSLETRTALGNDLRADMVVSIHVNADEANDRVYGIQTFYNGDYFIPELGNVELADFLEREVVTAVQGKANGLFESDENDYLLEHAKVPAAVIEVGYLSNPEEAGLLSREEYREKLAEGIYNAIESAYEWKEEKK